MSKYFTNNLSVINLYKEPSIKSEVVTQMIFGESFSISKKTKNWLRVKIKEDGYKGFIQNKKFPKFLKPTHKIHVLKAKVYKFPSKKILGIVELGSNTMSSGYHKENLINSFELLDETLLLDMNKKYKYEKQKKEKKTFVSSE